MNRLRRANKLFAVFTSILMLVQSFFPIFPLITPQVFAQEVTPTETQTVSEPAAEQSNTQTTETAQAQEASPTETPAPTETQTPSPTPADVTPTPAEVSQPSETGPPSDTQGEIGADGAATTNSSNEPDITITPVAEPSATLKVPTELVYATEGQSFNDTTEEYWNIDLEKGSAETKGKVQLGVKYIFPLEHKVTVTFTALPKDESLRANLNIQKVKVSDLNLPDDVKPYGEFAYDITTGMTDGDFEYDVTLPKPENQTAELLYMEDANAAVQPVSSDKTSQEGDKVKASDLDHFTIFLVSANLTTAAVNNQSQVTVGPSEQVTATLTVQTSGTNSADDWKSMNWRLDTGSWSSCNTSPNHNNDGTYTDTFTNLITAPASVGSYDVSFRAYNSNDCTGTYSDTTLVDGIIVALRDLTATKTNNVSGNATVGQPFVWTITVTNTGSAPAIFTNNKDILQDNLPDSDDFDYSPTSNISVSTTGGITGGFDCDIDNGDDLDCDADNTLTIPPGATFSLSITTTPTSTGTFTNPRGGSGNKCQVDPDGLIAETNESNNNCTDTINVAPDTGTTNPALGQACGLDIALILDNSTSISESELNTMKSAMTAFTAAFTGTPTQFSVTRFATTANVLQGFTANLTDVNNAINGISVAGGYTNWEDGLLKGQSTLPNRTNPDLVVFASDGNPNTVDSGPGDNASESQAVSEAVLIANSIKTNGARILALGIGNDLDTANLQAISGPNVNTGLTSDVITSNFATLADDLAEYAIQLCGGTITAQKFIDDDGDLQTTNDRTAASGWTFDVNGSPSNPAPVQTDAQGFTPAIDIEAGTYSITETPQSGYALLSANCTKANQSIGSSITNGVGSMEVGANDIVSCTFINTTNVDLPSYICHATGAENHWVKNYPATLGQLQGHVGVGHQNGDDIIPPVAVFLPLGQNWDAEGQAIWANDCAIPPKEGSIKVNKLLDNDGNGSYETINPASFTWSLDGTGNNNMGTTVSDVLEGNHTINENTVTNYHLVGWFPGGTNSTQYSCTNLPQGNTTLPAAVRVTANQTTEITICNALDTGTITVRKMVDRDGNGTYDETNPADFTWTLDGVGPYAMGFSNTAVPVGSHNINENSPSNYHFVGWFPTGQQGWSCTNLPANTQNTNFHQLPIPVNVGSGGTSDYTICNARNTGSVTIIKVVDGGTALPADWDFTISSVAGTFKSGNSVTLPTGSYTVTESGPADYSATAVTGICSGLQGSAATMTVTENGGTCTFTNTRDTGSLKVNKRTDGNGDGDYQDSGEGVNESDSNGFTWSIDGSGTNAIGATVAGVTTGNHDIGENTVAGYHFVGWFTTSKTQYSCTNPEGTTLPVSVAVAKNKIAEITLCNARDSGTITIVKDAQPDSSTDFSFEADFLDISGADFKLDDDTNNSLPNSRSYTIVSGAHSVEEVNIPSDWKLTSIICNDQNSTGDLDDREATINVSNGETVTCTFVNQKLGKLIIRKETSPNNSNKEFDFTRSFGSGFDLEDGDSRTFDNLTPGNYTVTEVGEPGWVLSSVVCSDQTQANGNAVTINLDYNETVTCTFNNTQLGKIRGYKFNDTNGDGNRDTGEEYLNGWSIFIDANTNGQYDDGELTQTTSGQFWFFGWHDEGEYEFANLLPGTYSVCEVPQDDWTNSTPLCQSTELTAGDTDEVYFGNHGPLTLRAYKIVCENESDLPNWGDNDAPNINATTAQNFVDNSEGACRFEEGWDFQWGYDGEVVKYGNGDQLGAAPSPWQTLGTTNASGYTEAAITSIDEDDDLWVREVLRANYVPFSYPPAAPTENAYSAEIYCHRDGQNYDNFDRVDDVRFGETYYCVAFNALNTGDIIVTKYNDDNGNGTQDEGEETLPGWDMTVQSVGDDIYNTTQTTGQDGTTTFEDVTVGDYVLTETLKEGWRQTELSCGDIRQDARLADDTADDSADDVEEETNGRFTLNGGQTVRCTVGNQFINPDLTITKSNDTAGGDRSPGGNVTFTLTVSAADSEVLDVIVKDLPAGGFTYRPGSWTAVSNVRGDLKALLVTTEPTYASPGTWNLGDMQEGEIVTLTYIADISNDEQPGLYRDLAWAQGKDLLANKVVANDTDSPQYFVGTEVNVVKNDQSGASVNVKQEVLGAVLGASTELPATGANSIWFIIAAIFMPLGSVTALAGWVLRRKYA